MDDAEILARQGGILVEMDEGRTFRVGHEGHLHFRVRNLTRGRGELTMGLRVPSVRLRVDERSLDLFPEDVHHVRFPLTSETPGEKLVEALDVRFTLAKRRTRLVLPDHSVTFQVAPADRGAAGTIDLSRATFNLTEHVGDFVLNLIQKQDARDPPAPEERWRALALRPAPMDGRAFVTVPRGVGVRDLVLVGPSRGAAPASRVFLFARRELVFGRSPEANLYLFRLPLDAANVHQSKLISNVHGRFALGDGTVRLRDESGNGTRLDGRRLAKGAWEDLPREFRIHLTGGEDVLELEGRVSFARHRGRELLLGWEATAPMGESLDVGAEHRLPVAALRLRRRGNHEHHTYVQVFRTASVGSDAACMVPVAGPGVEARHAELVFFQGEWFVRSLGRAATEVNGQPVRGDEHVSIAPGKTLTLGGLDLHVRRPEPADFLAS